MHTNLMGTSRFKLRLHTSKVLETLFDIKMRYRITSTSSAADRAQVVLQSNFLVQ